MPPLIVEIDEFAKNDEREDAHGDVHARGTILGRTLPRGIEHVGQNGGEENKQRQGKLLTVVGKIRKIDLKKIPASRTEEGKTAVDGAEQKIYGKINPVARSAHR